MYSWQVVSEMLSPLRRNCITDGMWRIWKSIMENNLILENEEEKVYTKWSWRNEVHLSEKEQETLLIQWLFLVVWRIMVNVFSMLYRQRDYFLKRKQALDGKDCFNKMKISPKWKLLCVRMIYLGLWNCFIRKS